MRAGIFELPTSRVLMAKAIFLYLLEDLSPYFRSQ